MAACYPYPVKISVQLRIPQPIPKEAPGRLTHRRQVHQQSAGHNDQRARPVQQRLDRVPGRLQRRERKREVSGKRLQRSQREQRADWRHEFRGREKCDREYHNHEFRNFIGRADAVARKFFHTRAELFHDHPCSGHGSGTCPRARVGFLHRCERDGCERFQNCRLQRRNTRRNRTRSLPCVQKTLTHPKNMAKKAILELTDKQVIDALNTRKDEEGKLLKPVTADNLWSECRAKEVGHRSCKCGQSGCGRQG